MDRSDLPLTYKQLAHHAEFGNISKQCVDFTRDGRQDLAVLFDGGGSGGVIAWAAFRRTRHDWKLALFKEGDRLSIAVVGSDLLENYPIYRPHDSHADPTGGVAHVQYGWVHGTLAVVARWRTAS